MKLRHRILLALALAWLTPSLLPAQDDAARTARVLAAVETFETKFRSLDSLADTGQPAGELMSVFSRELPAPIASSLSTGIADFINKYGGLDAFSDLIKAAPERYRASLPSVLSAERQELLSLRQAIVKGTAPVPTDWAKRRAAWPPAARGKRGPIKSQIIIDLPRTRIRAVIQGDFGALFDLGIASEAGSDTPEDGSLMHFWGALGVRVDRATALNILGQPWDSVAYYRAVAEAGSTWGMAQLAQKLLPADQSPIPPGEARSWLEKAAGLGYTGADRYLKWRGLTETVASVQAKTTTAQSLPEQAVPAEKPPAAVLENQPVANSRAERQAQTDKLTPALVALEKFDQAFLSANSVGLLGVPAAELVNALDELPDKKLADATFNAALAFLQKLGGAWGYHNFLMKVNEGRLAAATAHSRANLTPAQKEIIRRLSDQTLNQVYSRPTAVVDTSAWPPLTEWKRGPQTSDFLDVTRVRRALLNGSRGAALDLTKMYLSGWGVPKDVGLQTFWYYVIERLIPEFGPVRNNPTETRRIELAAGSADTLIREADALLAKPEYGAHPDEIVSLLRRADQGGATHAAKALADLEAGNRRDAALANLTAAQKQAIAAALAEFDTQTMALADLKAWGQPLGKLVAALDAQPHWRLAQAVAQNAVQFADKLGGADAFVQYHRLLPAARQTEALRQLTPEKLALFRKLGAGTPLSPDEAKTWLPATRHRPDHTAGKEFDPGAVRLALAGGVDGAGYDLFFLHGGAREETGDGVLKMFWSAVSLSLLPATQGKKGDEEKVMRAMQEGGSAYASYWIARLWLNEKQPDRDKILALLRTASAGGYLPANATLAQVENGPKPAPAPSLTAALPGSPEDIDSIVKALMEFDESTVDWAEGFDQWCSELGDLVTALDATHNRALAEAVFTVARKTAEQSGGAEGFRTFYGAISPSRQQTALAALTAARRAVVMQPEKTPGDWRPAEWAKGNRWLPDKSYDRNKVRTALARGRNGAAFDLSFGLLFANAPELFEFWSDVGKVLVPGSVTEKDPTKLEKLLVDSGYAKEVFARAQKTAEQKGATAPEVIALYRQAAEGGYRAADDELSILARNAADAAKKAPKAAEAKSVASGPANPGPKPAADEIPADEIKRMVAALGKFDSESCYGIESYVEWGEVLGELVTALDASPNRALADAVFGAARRFAEDFGGADGFVRFHGKLPPARRSAALAALPTDRRKFVQLGGTPPGDWTAVERTGPPVSMNDGAFEEKKVLAALARGRHGAAFDLSSGLMFGEDETLNKFWFAVAEALVPAAGKAATAAETQRVIAAAGGAEALGEQARQLALKRGENDPEALALLHQSVEGGYKAAVWELGSRKLNQAEAAQVRAVTTEAKVVASGTVRAEPAGSGEGGVQLLQLKDIFRSLSAVRYQAGLYAAASDNGAVFFSRDALQWEIATLGTKDRIEQILHDGERWVATVGVTSKPGLYFSTDRKTWTSSNRWNLGNYRLVVRPGRFWSAHVSLGSGYYQRGRWDASPDEQIKEWDSQVNELFAGPCAAFEAGGRIGLVSPKGLILESDNGEYWEQIGQFSMPKAEYAHYAEGNGITMLALTRRQGLASDLELQVRAAGQRWTRVKPPFKELMGLAYGLGRFVAIGGVRQEGKWELFESSDGVNWTRVSRLNGATDSLTYGPAGFVAVGRDGQLALYRPAPLPEKPMPMRPPTPIPDIAFRDFGTNYSGSGKYRTVIGPRTPDQIKEAELRKLVGNADAGEIAAKRELAFAILEGKYALPNPWRAELWFKDAMAAGDASAGRGYGLLLLQWKPQTPAAQIAGLFRDSANRGDVPAMVWLAENLKGTEAATQAEIKKWTEAVRSRDPDFAHRDANRKSYADNLARAEAGDPEAIMRVAPLLLSGNGVEPDPTKALNLLDKAAVKKHAPALHFLIDRYEKEVASGEKEPRRCLTPKTYTDYLRTLGETGDATALQKLAAAFAEGRNGVTRDDTLAYAAGLKLANLGDAGGMAFVGGALVDGRGVTKDVAAGTNWIKQAAAKGHAPAKAWLEQQAVAAQRASSRAPTDGRVDNIPSEVFAALETIQAGSSATLSDADMHALFNAVWFDAEYSIIEEDLAQELAGATRPLSLSASDGRKLTFTKTIPAAGAAGFANVLPAAFTIGNLQYYFTLWQQTANAGLLISACRLNKETHVLVQNALMKQMFDLARITTPDKTKQLTAYFTQLYASFEAASPAVKDEFRKLIQRAVEQADFAAKQMGEKSLSNYPDQPWLKNPPAKAAQPAASPAKPKTP